ncbi:MAG: capsular polysaccharide export protein [Paracoccaceae bacterium]
MTNPPDKIAFVCLNPRKTKKHRVMTMLAAAGNIRFFSFAPLGFKPYPETPHRARAALETSTNTPQSAFVRNAKLWLYRRQYAGSRSFFEAHPDAVAVAWNGLNSARRVFMDAAKDAGNKTLFFELAPFPDRITIDPNGVNFHNSLPRVPVPYVAWAKTNAIDQLQWHSLRDTITQRQPATPPAPLSSQHSLDGNFVFVPLQVPGDSQLRIFGGAFKTVDTFVQTILTAASKCPPDWHIRIKEHPTAAPFVRAAIEASGCSNVVLDNATNTFEQVKKSKLVMTINSSVGMEAMFYEKPVVAAGNCFWAIEGIAEHAGTADRIEQVLSEPAKVTFDPEARHAFLNYLDHCYYPKLSAPNIADIHSRLGGPDAYGFWQTQEMRDVLV